MRKSQPFDLAKAIPQAWAFLWADNLRQRAEDEKKSHVYRPGNTYFLTASDVENQVRQFAQDQHNGKKWGDGGRAYGRAYTFVRITGAGNLQALVRSWLLREVRMGRLSSHNFGRGHISGMRFRPYGEPLAESEVKTIKVKEARADKPRIQHSTRRYGGRPLCMEAQMKGKGMGWRPSKAWTTTQWDKVTCPRCLKLPQPMKAEEVA
jgi:hypothetical protein